MASHLPSREPQGSETSSWDGKDSLVATHCRTSEEPETAMKQTLFHLHAASDGKPDSDDDNSQASVETLVKCIKCGCTKTSSQYPSFLTPGARPCLECLGEAPMSKSRKLTREASSVSDQGLDTAAASSSGR